MTCSLVSRPRCCAPPCSDEVVISPRRVFSPPGHDAEHKEGPSSLVSEPTGLVWRVKDSNLRSFRDGFTVRSHWPLGQPAVSRGPEVESDATRRKDSAAPADRENRRG